MRLKSSSIVELTREFIKCRTPFFTFKVSGEDREGGNLGLPGFRNYTGNRIGLGERPLGHVLDNADYVAYEAVQKRLLNNQRIARAVIKRGLILSRLASSLVDKEDVFDGPSGLASDHPVQIKVTKNGCSLTYYDDGISEEEIATFVGLYSIQGSKSAFFSLAHLNSHAGPIGNGVPSELSWWPTLSKFEESGLNLGIWTPRCEEWFQTRGRSTSLVAGENMERKPLSSKQWRNQLRCEMETKRMLKGARILASRYIAKYYAE